MFFLSLFLYVFSVFLAHQFHSKTFFSLFLSPVLFLFLQVLLFHQIFRFYSFMLIVSVISYLSISY